MSALIEHSNFYRDGLLAARRKGNIMLRICNPDADCSARLECLRDVLLPILRTATRCIYYATDPHTDGFRLIRPTLSPHRSFFEIDMAVALLPEYEGFWAYCCEDRGGNALVQCPWASTMTEDVLRKMADPRVLGNPASLLTPSGVRLARSLTKQPDFVCWCLSRNDFHDVVVFGTSDVVAHSYEKAARWCKISDMFRRGLGGPRA